MSRYRINLEFHLNTWRVKERARETVELSSPRGMGADTMDIDARHRKNSIPFRQPFISFFFWVCVALDRISDVHHSNTSTWMHYGFIYRYIDIVGSGFSGNALLGINIYYSLQFDCAVSIVPADVKKLPRSPNQCTQNALACRMCIGTQRKCRRMEKKRRQRGKTSFHVSIGNVHFIS